MAQIKFTQTELNRIVASRLKRERERLAKEFENKMKRCMAAVHLTLYQEMCSLKWELGTETNDTLLSDLIKDSKEQSPETPAQKIAKQNIGKGR